MSREEIKDSWGNVTHYVETDIWGNDKVYETTGLFGEFGREIGTKDGDTLSDKNGNTFSPNGIFGELDKSHYDSLSSSSKSSPSTSDSPSSSYGGGGSYGGQSTSNEDKKVIKTVVWVIVILIVLFNLPFFLILALGILGVIMAFGIIGSLFK